MVLAVALWSGASEALSKQGPDRDGDSSEVYIRINEITGDVAIMDGGQRWRRAYGLPFQAKVNPPKSNVNCEFSDEIWPQYTIPGLSVVFVSPKEVDRLGGYSEFDTVDRICRFYVRPYRYTRKGPFIYFFYPRPW